MFQRQRDLAQNIIFYSTKNEGFDDFTKVACAAVSFENLEMDIEICQENQKKNALNWF